MGKTIIIKLGPTVGDLKSGIYIDCVYCLSPVGIVPSYLYSGF